MTAVNAFRDENQFAYIASDGAAFSYTDGTVMTLGGKVSLFPEYRMAWAMTGPNLSAYIVAEVSNHPIATQSDLLDAMEKAFRLCRKNIAFGAPDREVTGGNDMTLIAALWHEIEERPAIYRIASNKDVMPEHPANKWHEIGGCFTPKNAPQHISETGLDLADLIPECRAMFRVQRHHDFGTPNGGICVGGTCSVYGISREGIQGGEILEFGDTVGSLPDISDTGVDVMRPIV